MAMSTSATSDGLSNTNKKNTTFCCVPQCSNYQKDVYAFFRFPKDENMRTKWKAALKMGKIVTAYDRVCEEHFFSSYFLPRAVPSARRNLKKNVIPSQKLPVRSHDVVFTSPQKKRMKNRISRQNARNHRKKLVDFGDGSDESDFNYDIENDVLPEEQVPDEQVPLVPVPPGGGGGGDPPDPPSREQGCKTERFSILTQLSDKTKFFTFTGVCKESTIDNIVKCALKIVPDSMAYLLPLKQRVVLCLIKLKLNLTYIALGVFFNISAKTCSNYFRDTVQVLAQALKGLIYLPSKEEILDNMPKCFKKFWRTRIVMDCAEIPVEKLKCLKERIMTYSHYKGRETLKLGVGVSPAGMICWLSKLYGGRASDKKIVVDSKILEKLDPGDAVMVDKGFLIEKECLENHLTLLRPPFLSKKKQLSREEALRCAEIASARVHVERAIRKLRYFEVLVHQVPSSLLPLMDDIVTVCGALVNLNSPILAEERF